LLKSVINGLEIARYLEVFDFLNTENLSLSFLSIYLSEAFDFVLFGLLQNIDISVLPEQVQQFTLLSKLLVFAKRITNMEIKIVIKY